MIGTLRMEIGRSTPEVVRRAVARLEAKRRAEGVCKRDPRVRMSTPPGEREPDRVAHGEPGKDGLCDACRAINRASAKKYRERRRSQPRGE